MMWIAVVIAILAGLAMCFYGYRLFRIWLAVAGFIGGAALGGFLGRTYLTGAAWPVVLAVVLGLGFAALSYSLYRLGVVLTGAVLGAALFYMITAMWGGGAGWLLLIGAVLGAVLSSIFIKPYIIVGSAFNGAYLAAMGAYSLIDARALTQSYPFIPGAGLPWYVYAVVLALTLAGTVAQFGLNRGRDLPDMARKKQDPNTI